MTKVRICMCARNGIRKYYNRSTARSEKKPTYICYKLQNIQIGGLETYKTTQQKMLIFIPVAPKTIWGYPLYRYFLDVVASALSQSDPSAQVSVETPSAT